MEKKQLDFNAPLLSVRRRFSPLLVPSNKDVKVVYDNALPKKRHNLLPVKSDIDLDQVTEPVAIPFSWELTPGRAKSKSGPQPQTRPLNDSYSVTPKLPPGKVLPIIPLSPKNKLQDQNKTRGSLGNINVRKLDSPKDDDDAYSDALDTLSRASFSLNCRVSGLSGPDGVDKEPSKSFCIDPQTREFMLNRFLPAAKAMTLETPHHGSRKQSLALENEQPRDVQKMASKDMKSLRTFQAKEEKEASESEDDISAIVLAESCGFLPGLKKSLRLFNPLPVKKLCAQSPKAIIGEVRRQKKSYSGPLSQNIDKLALDTIMYKNKFDNGGKNKQTGKSNHVNYSGELQTATRLLSPYRNSRSGGISPYRNEPPVSPLRRTTGFLGIPKEAENSKPNSPNINNKAHDNLKNILSYRRNEREPALASPSGGKTMDRDSVDTVQFSKLPNSSIAKSKMVSSNKNVEILAERTGVRSNVSKGSSVAHVKDHTETVRNSSPLQKYPSEKSYGRSPPLPKSPSEAWLWRALPSIPSRNPSPHSRRKLVPTSSISETKWENIVKTSFLHHDHARYSEELVANVRKQTRA